VGNALSQLIDKEVASLPEDLQRKVYDFAMRLKKSARSDEEDAVLQNLRQLLE
jgi:hypothetical protein